MMLTSFSEWVRATRRSKDFTIVEVATRAGVKQSVWSSWERGTHTPRRETVIKIAEALHEPVDGALFRAGYVPAARLPSGTLAPLEELLQEMPEERRSRAVDAMRRLGETFLTVTI